jgi:hypothetical protein
MRSRSSSLARSMSLIERHRRLLHARWIPPRDQPWGILSDQQIWVQAHCAASPAAPHHAWPRATPDRDPLASLPPARQRSKQEPAADRVLPSFEAVL